MGLILPRWERSLEGGHGNTVLFLLEKPHGQRNLADCSPLDHKELDMTEAT